MTKSRGKKYGDLLRKNMVSEKYVNLVMEIYRKIKTKIKAVAGMTGNFDALVGLHQGSGSVYSVDWCDGEGKKRSSMIYFMYVNSVVLVGE